MSVIFFLWFWTCELIAIGVIAIGVGLIFGQPSKEQEQPEEEQQ